MKAKPAVLNVLVALIALFAQPGLAATSGPKNLSNTGFASGPVLAVDPTGTFVNVVWKDSSSGVPLVYFSRSSDGGKTFLPPKSLSQGIGDVFDLQLAVDAAGNINVVWIEDLTSSYQVMFSRSTDGGATFSFPIPMPVDMSANTVKLAVDSAGNISVLWIGYDLDYCSSVLFAHSTDGQSFAVNFLDSGCYPYPAYPRLVVDAQNNINALWVQDMDGDDSIYFSRSSDGGTAFSPPTFVSYAGVSDIDFAVSPSAIAVIWADTGISDYGFVEGTHLRRSTDGGATFDDLAPISTNPDYCVHVTTNPAGNFDAIAGGSSGSLTFAAGADLSLIKSISNAGSARCGVITVDSSGTITVIWQEDQPSGSQLFFERSSDGGSTFTPPDNVSNNLGYAYWPRLGVDGTGKAYSVWTQYDPQTGLEDVFFTSFPDLTSTEFNVTVADTCANGSCGAFAGSGTVTSSPGGLDCSSFPCTATFPRDTVVTLTATPAPNSFFAEWTGGCTGTDPCVLKMTAARIVAARFEKPHFTLHVVNDEWSEGRVTSVPAGIDCGSMCDVDFPSGAEVSLTASSSPGTTFTGWGGDCSGTAGCIVTMDQNRNVTASFSGPVDISVVVATVWPPPVQLGDTLKYELIVKNSGPNTAHNITLTDVLPPGVTFLGFTSGRGCTFANGTVTCAAPFSLDPSSYFFVDIAVSLGTTGILVNHATVSTTDNDTFLDNNAASLSFAFPSGVGIDVSITGTGAGTVGSNPPGISCGGVCSAFFAAATVVTLTATPAAGSQFGGWLGDCAGTGSCLVTMDKWHSVTAIFLPSPSQFRLNVSPGGSGSGTITSSPAGISCGPSCSAMFDAGAIVTLSANPAAGSQFGGWSGDCAGTGSCLVTMNGPHAVTATFVVTPPPSQFALNVFLGGSGSGSVSSSPTGIACGATCSAMFVQGTTVSLSAAPASGSVFNGWTGDCSGTGPCSLVMSTGHAATANFNLAASQFAFGDPPPPQSVTAGQAAHFTIGVLGQNGFSGPVSFACTGGLPTGAHCSFSPPTVTAGAQPVSTLLTIITTPRPVASMSPHASLAELALSLPAFGMVLLTRKRASTRRNLVVWVGLLIVVSLAGCGGGAAALGSGGGGNAGTPAGTYNVTVVASSGGLSQSQIVTLNVN